MVSIKRNNEESVGIDNKEIIKLYEDLRCNSLEGKRGQPIDIGQSIFIQRGTMEWIRECSMYMRKKNEMEYKTVSNNEEIPGYLRNELVDVLTNMVLYHRIKGDIKDV